jgi:uncharacterized membrane protein
MGFLGLSPPRRFLFLATLFGIAFVVINPPFAVNDEDVHIARIFELASGRLLTRTDAEGEFHEVPRDYVELGQHYQAVRHTRQGSVQAGRVLNELTASRPEPPLVRTKARAGGYSPVAYLPHIPTLWLVEKFDVGVLVHLYAVRLASLAAYILMAWFAISRAGPLQWIFVGVGLMPMSLTQAAGVSGDGTVIGASLVFFALLTKGGLLPQSGLSRAELCILLGCVTLLCLCKPIYIVVAAALPVLRWQGRHARLWRWGVPLLAVAPAVMAYGIWSYLNRDLGANQVHPYSASGQLQWAAHNPVGVLELALGTVVKQGDDLLVQCIAVRHRVSEGVRFLGGVVVALYGPLLLATALGCARRIYPGVTRDRRQAITFLLVCWGLLVLSVPSALYLCCTRIGAETVRGLQGRYFIPAVAPLLLALSLVGRPLLARWLRGKGGRSILVTIAVANVLCLFSLVGWHYFGVEDDWPF